MKIEFKNKKGQERRIEMVRVKEEEESAKKTAEVFSLPYESLALKPVASEALNMISENQAKNALLAVVHKEGEVLHVAVYDPENNEAQKIINRLKKKFSGVLVLVVSKHSLEKAWSGYEKKEEKKEISGKISVSKNTFATFRKEISTITKFQKAIKNISSQKDVSIIVELLLAGSLALDASDIHVEPGENAIRLRLRIDGILHKISEFDKHTYKLLLSRIKLLSSLKLNVHNVAQDGRFSIDIGDSEIQIRTSILPGEYGENIVMRILDPASLLSVEDLGIREDLLKHVEKEIQKPNGMVLTTGPTGSGKTTTLYAFLKKLRSPKIKIITIEDPIEYHLEGISQTQVMPEKGYTFASGLRSILRQDPDVILVGEIRDLETADTANQAALTGHLVLSTLHTNDAAGVIPRMVDIGANPATIGPALNIAIAQRLIRRICKKCKTLRKIKKEELAILKNEFESNRKKLEGIAAVSILLKKIGPELTMTEPKGCELCNNSGYKGRIGIYEILVVTPEFEKFILGNPSITEIRELAEEEGMTTLKQDGFLKVIEGLTTIEEVERISGT